MSENIIGSSGSKVPASSVGRYLKNNLRESGMLLSLVAIMIFFQIVTGGVLMKPLNLTNLVLQNSYIVIMALGMLLIIVTGHIFLPLAFMVNLDALPVWLVAGLWSAFFAGLSILLLPRAKGVMLAILWQTRATAEPTVVS